MNRSGDSSYSPMRSGAGGGQGDRPPTEMASLFPGCDYEHWLIVMDKPGGEGATKEQMIDCYVSKLEFVVLNSIFNDLLFGHHDRFSHYVEFSSSKDEYSDASIHLVKECLCGNGSFEAIDRGGNRDLFSQWLLLPLYGIKLGCKFTSNCFQCCCTYVQNIKIKVSGFFSRVKRTLKGSTDDIGWLQSTEGFPSVDDGTAQFMELLNDISNLLDDHLHQISISRREE